jgi:spoIIIJ-associated protein
MEIETGAAWLQELIRLMGIEVSVRQEAGDEFLGSRVERSPDNHYWLHIDANTLQEQQIQRLIGDDGTVIDAMQYLTNLVMNSHTHAKNSQQMHSFYTVELNSYRVNRFASLQSMVSEQLQQVRATGQEVVLKNLSSADRRYVHQVLDELADIENHSYGKEPHRYLVMRLKG